MWLRVGYQQKQTELNLADSLARNSLYLFTGHKELEAFVDAIKAGKILQKYKETDPDVMHALITNIYEGSELNHLKGHNSWVLTVSFSPDGKILASGSSNKTIKLWDIDLDSLIGRSCDWVRNYLQHNPNVRESDRHLCDGLVLKSKVA